ncbi:MAG: hypothetical protein ACT4P1_10575 [Sporichthyaceae bacterium]
MTENMNEAASPATHKGAGTEGSVRVLGQTAAVAGISGVLLLALKAMILVSPAVLPGSDELDALGRPNAIVATDSNAAPVSFAPVATSPAPAVSMVDRKPSGTSERNASPAAPKPVVSDVVKVVKPKPAKPVVKPAKPVAKPAAEDKGPVGGIGDIVTGITDKTPLKPVGDVVGGLTDTVDKTTKNLPLVGGSKGGSLPIVGDVAKDLPIVGGGSDGGLPIVGDVAKDLPLLGGGGLLG